MPDRSSRYLLDSNVFIAAVKHEWTKSTELIYHLLNRPVELFANDLLISSMRSMPERLELTNY